MFSGFQSNAFQNNAFQIARQAPAPSGDTHDGGGIHNHKRYRKYLESLTRATSLDKLKDEVIEAAREVIDFPVDTPELEKLSNVVPEATENHILIDFNALAREISLLEAYLNMMNIHRLNTLQMQLDDEFTILMLSNS